MISIQHFYGSFEPTEQWVPDLVHSLNYQQLESMVTVREEVEHDTGNPLIFGIGKPKLRIKVDNATQTNRQHKTNDAHQSKYFTFFLYIQNGRK